MTPSLAAFINSLLLGLFIVVIPVGTAVYLVSTSDRLTRG
nr:photosystem II protein X [Chroomonas debatzensis]